METIKNTKANKSAARAVAYQSVRLTQNTFRKLQKLTDAVNKKEFGKKVRADTVIDAALSLVCAKKVEAMRCGSMSNADRLELPFRQSCLT